jgi:mono/diheme cytochrome c family protein
LFVASGSSDAHDLITTKLTWSREISRVVIPKCGGCHREGGAAFPLTTYEQVRPWAKAIKEQVLERQMPPVAAVRGFSDLWEDESLTQEQIGLIAAWVEGGAPEGDRALLPPELVTKSARKSPVVAVTGTLNVAGIRILESA